MYETELRRNGKVMLSRFHREKVQPLIPGLSYPAFLERMKRVRKRTAQKTVQKTINEESITAISEVQEDTIRTLSNILRIGADTIRQIIEDPDSLSPKDKLDLFFKAMKAQDSRMVTIAKVKREDREATRFMEKFAEQAYDTSIQRKDEVE